MIVHEVFNFSNTFDRASHIAPAIFDLSSMVGSRKAYRAGRAGRSSLCWPSWPESLPGAHDGQDFSLARAKAPDTFPMMFPEMHMPRDILSGISIKVAHQQDLQRLGMRFFKNQSPGMCISENISSKCMFFKNQPPGMCISENISSKCMFFKKSHLGAKMLKQTLVFAPPKSHPGPLPKKKMIIKHQVFQNDPLRHMHLAIVHVLHAFFFAPCSHHGTMASGHSFMCWNAFLVLLVKKNQKSISTHVFPLPFRSGRTVRTNNIPVPVLSLSCRLGLLGQIGRTVVGQV